MAPLSAPFVAGALAYMLATFNGGYLWYTVLFTKQYLSLQIWSRLVDPAIHFGVVAVALQAVLVSYMLPHFQRATGTSGPLSGARFGLWVAGFVASTAIFAHSEKNTSTCVQGYIAIEGVYCLVQFPLSCALVAFARERARRAAAK